MAFIIPSKKIFISHATTDYELVRIFLSFFNTIGIGEDDRFCTSEEGTLESGNYFNEDILIIYVTAKPFYIF